MHIFNHEHSVIGVYDADTGDVITNCVLDDICITNYALLDDRTYLYLCGWVWTPFAVRGVYRIDDILAGRSIKPVYLPCDESRRQDKNYLDQSVELFGFATCAELLAGKDVYFANIAARKAAEQFNAKGRECLLWHILHPAPDDNAQITATGDQRAAAMQLFAQPLTKLTIGTIGNVTGAELHFGWAISTNNRNAWDDTARWQHRDNLAQYVVQVVCRPGDLILPIGEITFKFIIAAEFVDAPSISFGINVHLQLAETGIVDPLGRKTYQVSRDLPIAITFLDM